MDEEYEKLATDMSRYLPYSYTKAHEWVRLLWVFGFSTDQIKDLIRGCLISGFYPEELIEAIYSSWRWNG